MSDKPRLKVKNGEIKSISVNKASNLNTSVSRLPKSDRGFGYSNFRSMSDYQSKEMVSALKWPESLKTFDKMDLDYDVKTGRELTQIFVEKAFTKPEVKYNKDSEESKEAAEFVKWALANMSCTLIEAIRNAYSCKKYGFSALVKNYEPITYGQYNGKYRYKIKSLSPRSQHTIDLQNPFLFNSDGEVTHIRQSLTRTSASSTYSENIMTQFEGKSYIDIPRNKFMLFSYDSVNGNPLGSSPYRAAYLPWLEKLQISQYETIGVSKGMSGVPVLYAPSSVLERAVNDPTSTEGLMVKQLNETLADWHAGDAASMILPSDITDGSTTQKQFDVKLQGIDGTGNTFNTGDIIAQRQKAILNCFGAAFILLGQNGTGSYSLADTQKGLHSFYIEKDVNFLCEVFNSDLIPQLLALNDIRLDDKDMPYLVNGRVDEKDVDMVSKAIQRSAAVGFIPSTPEVVNELLRDLGYEYRIPEELYKDEDKWLDWSSKYMPKAVSRSGDGMTEGMSSGVGTSVEVDTLDTSVSNNENV